MKIITPNLWIEKPSITQIMEVIPPSKDKICISTQEGHHIITKQDIDVLQASGNYTTITISGQKILCAQTLCSIMDKINLSNFIRIHKSHAVNLNKVAFINSSMTLLKLDNGIELPIARARKEEIRMIIQTQFS